MQKRSKVRPHFGTETGSVLLIVAASMVLLLAISAFAIDLANFYLARAQAQRASDAAALAGANAFVTSGCLTGGCVQGGTQDALARQMAESAGAQNYVAGQPANIKDSDVVLNEVRPYEPQVTVTVRRAVPTFFAKIFGVDTANISTSSTAEAYTPSVGGDSQVTQYCLKPFLVPNCDPVHIQNNENPACQDTGGGGYFFKPGIPGDPETVVNPEKIKGETWQLHTEEGPSQWYLVGFDGAPPSSGSALRDHITECIPIPVDCGQTFTTLTTANGVNVGPISQGIEELINADGYGLNQGQDSIDLQTLVITGGSNNSNQSLVNQPLSSYNESPSVVTIPVYQGGTLSPGGSVVGIVGYLQVFIEDVVHNGNDNHVDVVILNASPCTNYNVSGSPPSSSTVSSSAGSPIAVRLIRTN